MKEEVQLIEYKKESFFERIKNKMKRIFFKKEQVKVNEENVDYVGLNKGEFFEIYEKVKKRWDKYRKFRQGNNSKNITYD